MKTWQADTTANMVSCYSHGLFSLPNSVKLLARIELCVAISFSEWFLCMNVVRLPWLALERWINLTNETVESDVYSFGMTIWEIFSRGERPFHDLHTMDEV